VARADCCATSDKIPLFGLLEPVNADVPVAQGAWRTPE